MSNALKTAPFVLPPLIARILYSPQQIADRVAQLGAAITRDYAASGGDLVAFGVLKGVLPFQADLLRAIDLPIRADVMVISGYRPGENRTPGMVKIIKDLDVSVVGRHVLIVEDMVDTGLTLNFIIKLMRQRRPASLAVVTLFNREANRLATNLPVRYVGFDAPDEFLVGYGLDYREQFRHLPYIGVLKSEVYTR
jgi:hypoxanthine phosphoribosyltransferase